MFVALCENAICWTPHISEQKENNNNNNNNNVAGARGAFWPIISQKDDTRSAMIVAPRGATPQTVSGLILEALPGRPRAGP